VTCFSLYFIFINNACFLYYQFWRIKDVYIRPPFQRSRDIGLHRFPVAYPETLEIGGEVDGVWRGQSDALYDSAEVPQVEQIVRLGRRRQKILDSFLVESQSRVHYGLNTRLEVVAESYTYVHTSAPITSGDGSSRVTIIFEPPPGNTV